MIGRNSHRVREGTGRVATIRSDGGSRTGYVTKSDIVKDDNGFEDIGSYWSNNDKSKKSGRSVLATIQEPVSRESKKSSPNKKVPLKTIYHMPDSSDEEDSESDEEPRKSISHFEKPTKVKTFSVDTVSKFNISDEDDSDDSDSSELIKDIISRKRDDNSFLASDSTPLSHKPSPNNTFAKKNQNTVSVSKTIDVSRKLTSVSRKKAAPEPTVREILSPMKEIEKKQTDTFLSPTTYLNSKNASRRTPPKSSVKIRSILKTSSSRRGDSLPVEEQEDQLVGSSPVRSLRIEENPEESDKNQNVYESPPPAFDDDGDDDFHSGAGSDEEEQIVNVSPVKESKTPKKSPRGMKHVARTIVESDASSTENSSDEEEPITKPKSKQIKSTSRSKPEKSVADNSYNSVGRTRNRTIAPYFDPETDAATPGLRRSKRRKWKPLEHWKGERLLMQLDCEVDAQTVVAAMKPDLFKTPAPMKRRKVTHNKKKESKTKDSKIKTESKSWAPIDLFVDDSRTPIEVENLETGETEHLTIVRNSADIVKTALPLDTESVFIDPKSKKKLPASQCFAGASFEDNSFVSGDMSLPPLSAKVEEHSGRFKQIFFVHNASENSLAVQINDCTYMLSTGDHFWIPADTQYAMKNYSPTEPATIGFVLLKPQ